MVLRTRIRGAQTADQHYAKRVGMRGHASTGLFGRGAPGGAASTGQRIGCFQRVRGFATASAVAFLGAHPADLLRALAAILYDPGSATRQRTLVWPPAGRQPAYACGAASIWGRLVYTHASARARARARAHTHTHTHCGIWAGLLAYQKYTPTGTCRPTGTYQVSRLAYTRPTGSTSILYAPTSHPQRARTGTGSRSSPCRRRTPTRAVVLAPIPGTDCRRRECGQL
jgi:hypothetical protein